MGRPIFIAPLVAGLVPGQARRTIGIHLQAADRGPHSTGMSAACLPETIVHTLGNGLEILIVPEHSSPVVSVQAWVKVGSVHEDRHLGAGISHLIEHLVFKGTRNYGATEAAKVVQEAGGYLNAYTGFERTVYWIDIPSEGLGTALDVTTDLVFHPLLPEADFEREKEVIRREIAMGRDDPRRFMSEELFATAYRSHPCRQPVIGHLGAFNRLTLRDVREFHESHYIPNNVFFVVAGDVDPEEVRRMLETRVGDLAPRGRATPVLPEEPAMVAPRRREMNFATDLARLQMAWHVPSHVHPDIPALDVLGRILGSGESGRLYRRLREEDGLAHDVSAGVYSPGFGGLFYVGADGEAAKLADLEAGVRREITRLVDDGVSERELEKARCGALADFLRGLESTNGLASQVGASWLLAQSTDYPGQYLDGLQAVAAEKVRAVAATYLGHGHSITVRMFPEAWTLHPSTPAKSATRHGGGGISETVLPNGIRLLTGRDTRLPLVSLHAFSPGGASCDPMDRAGQSSWMASGLWKGTGQSSAAELAERIEGKGGAFSALGGTNSVGLSIEMLSADFDLAVDTLAEVIQGAGFPEDAMERERAAMVASARERELQPLASAMAAARKSLFAGTPFQNPAAGSVESLTAMSRDELAPLWQSTRDPSRMVLGVFGDFDPDLAARRIGDAFASLTGGLSRHAQSTRDGESVWSPPMDGYTGTLRRPKEQAVLAVVFPTGGLLADDATALDLIDEACGDMGSRFFQRIREEQGLAYYIGPFQIKGRHLGGFGFYLGTSADKLDHAQSELLDEIHRLAAGGLADDELHRAKQSWRGKFLLQNQSIDARGRMAVVNTVVGLGKNHSDEQLEAARQLTGPEVAAVAARVFGRAPVVVRVLPEGA